MYTIHILQWRRHINRHKSLSLTENRYPERNNNRMKFANGPFLLSL